jgi:hypothetical protein
VNCTKCGNEIPKGQRYVADVRHIERIERRFLRTAITVKNAKEIGTYHYTCAPQRPGVVLP